MGKSYDDLSPKEQQRLERDLKKGRSSEHICRKYGLDEPELERISSSSLLRNVDETINSIKRTNKLGIAIGALSIAGSCYLFSTLANVVVPIPQETKAQEQPEQPDYAQPQAAKNDPVFYPLTEVSLDEITPEALESLKPQFHLDFMQNIPDYSHIVSIKVLSREEGIFLPQNSFDLENRIKKYTDMTNDVKKYFCLPVTFEYRAVRSVDDIVDCDPNHYIGNLVHTNGFRTVLAVTYQTTSGKQESIPSTNYLPVAEAHLSLKYDFSIVPNPDGKGQQLQMRLDPAQSIVSVKNQYNLNMNGAAEFLHFAARKRDSLLYMDSLTQDDVKDGQPPQRPELLVLNEGVVHGCLFSALEDLNYCSPEISHRIIDLMQQQDIYSRVLEFYELSESQGALEVFRRYITGKITK